MKDNKIHPTYCKRCTTKRSTESRHAKITSPKEPSAMAIFLDGIREDVSEMLSHVDVGDEAQLTELTEAFGNQAAQRVAPLLHLYAQARKNLPEKVYDQRIEVE